MIAKDEKITFSSNREYKWEKGIDNKFDLYFGPLNYPKKADHTEERKSCVGPIDTYHDFGVFDSEMFDMHCEVVDRWNELIGQYKRFAKRAMLLIALYDTYDVEELTGCPFNTQYLVDNIGAIIMAGMSQHDPDISEGFYDPTVIDSYVDDFHFFRWLVVAHFYDDAKADLWKEFLVD